MDNKGIFLICITVIIIAITLTCNMHKETLTDPMAQRIYALTNGNRGYSEKLLFECVKMMTIESKALQDSIRQNLREDSMKVEYK